MVTNMVNMTDASLSSGIFSRRLVFNGYGICGKEFYLIFVKEKKMWIMVKFSFQATTLCISGTDKWKVSTFQIQLAFELVLNNGPMAFIQHVSSILCPHLMFLR